MPPMPRALVVAILALAPLATTVAAQTGTAAPPPAPLPVPCANDPDAHRFDFWIGEWDVRPAKAGAQGPVVGSSSIQSVSGGCALLENWTSARGGTGKSLNAYNRGLKRWQQYWVGQGGEVTEYRESSWDGPSLVFVSRDVAADGARSMQRLTFTPVAADVVRQHGELSTDEGRTWKTTYDFYYYRRTAAAR